MGLAAEVAVNESKDSMPWLTLLMLSAQNVIIMTAYDAFGNISSAYHGPGKLAGTGREAGGERRLRITTVFRS